MRIRCASGGRRRRRPARRNGEIRVACVLKECVVSSVAPCCRARRAGSAGVIGARASPAASRRARSAESRGNRSRSPARPTRRTRRPAPRRRAVIGYCRLLPSGLLSIVGRARKGRTAGMPRIGGAGERAPSSRGVRAQARTHGAGRASRERAYPARAVRRERRSFGKIVAGRSGRDGRKDAASCWPGCGRSGALCANASVSSQAGAGPTTTRIGVHGTLQVSRRGDGKGSACDASSFLRRADAPRASVRARRRIAAGAAANRRKTAARSGGRRKSAFGTRRYFVADATTVPASTMPAPGARARQDAVAGDGRAVLASFCAICAGVRFGLTASISEATPATCGAARLVPLCVPYASVVGTVVPALLVDRMFEPGALSVMSEPKLLYHARWPVLSVAPTEITPLQLAGRSSVVAWPSLPAETTTVVPRAITSLIACWNVSPHGPVPPRLRLITFAGVRFVGAPATGMPAAQRIASAMSLVVPPHLPSTRTGRILPYQLTPAMPMPLFAAAPMMPATCVPCQLLFDGALAHW
ncbi:ribonuclease E [Burkholderia pseudomallei MSHR1043]|uniref:Putative ribonuclease E n=1 Tax=Burkholderia pseudomallei (strain 1710b) TaxID=320372 RepID=Q3JFB9_BURP1|nr:putative ribonuclease E [Burkholderia pseudomallei 1710b]EMP75126.1 ribonuclease E [Burkholderia pseudomallei MSHR1043]